ncbi:MAG: D-alanyl-D-alanine carboxypeptidase family protein [Myxococcales bacterium]|nr:D-alanyl-D-alanine carboxypeptidase family protein [Myxococcales bacterium]
MTLIVLLTTASRAAALSSIDCTESTDTGYSSGNAFPIQVVTVDGKKMEKESANAYIVMAKAADAAGVTLKVVSGFRTMAEQQYLYGCYVNCSCNSCNLAAKPGYSNHQSGHAIDLNTSSGGVYAWLEAHAGSFGWKRTVPSEPWHWEWWGGGPGGGACGGHPKGYLDTASCETVAGWAQDPDAPNQAIDVHVYFGGPAGAAGAAGVSVPANDHRADLCSAIGSCEHGFDLLSPFGLHDGQPHAVHAYGINLGSGANQELGSSPKTLTCPPKALSGYRRHVTDPTSYEAWGFSDFFDRAPVTDVAIDALAEGAPWPAKPELMIAEGGGAVYQVDGSHRRHVPNPAAMDAWHFSWSAIQTWTPSKVAGLADGPALSQRPLLVRHSSGAVYVVDALAPDPAPAPGGTAGGGGSGGAGEPGTAGVAAGGWGGGTVFGTGGADAEPTDDESVEGGCSVSGLERVPVGWSAVWTLGVAWAFARRRRV